MIEVYVFNVKLYAQDGSIVEEFDSITYIPEHRLHTLLEEFGAVRAEIDIKEI